MSANGIVFRGVQARAARSSRSHDRRLVRVLSLLGLVLMAGSAMAQQRADQLFERLDRNGDGAIDEQELTGARLAAFERADANGDHYVDGSERSELVEELEGAAGGGPRSALVRKPLAQRRDRLERIDTDGDGRISQDEFVAAPSPLLRFDGNGDGRITRAEMDSARPQPRGAESRRRR